MQHSVQRPLSLGIHQVSYQPKEMGNRFPAISIISVYLISTYLCDILWYMSQIKATTLKRNIARLPLALGIGVIFFCYFSSVQFSHSVVSNSLRPHELQHARPPCPSPTPGVHPDSHPSSQWCHPAISSSVVPFSLCPQFISASVVSRVNSRMRWPNYWSFSFSIIPSKEHQGLISFRVDWLDSLQSMVLSGVFSHATVQKCQFFGAKLSSQYSSHIHT